MTGIKSTLDMVGQAFSAVYDFGKQFVDSASESEQAVARLEGVLQATGGAVGLTSEQLQGMANGLQDVTRFSDETILNGEAILLTFRNIGAEMFERTVPAMADMAEIFGSVDSAAMQLGKALNDPVTGMGALSRAGITFSDVQKEMIKNFVETGDIASAQNIIMSEVEAQVKGLAEAMGNTFAGQVEIAKNKLDTFKELIGGPIIAGLTELLSVFNDFDIQADFSWAGVLVSFLERWNELLSGGAPFWYSLGITLYEFQSFVPAFENIGKIFMDLQNDLDMGIAPLDAFKNALVELKPFITEFLSSATSAFGAAFETALIAGIDTIDWNRIGLSFNAAMQEGFTFDSSSSGPLSQSIGNALTALVSGGFGYTNWDTLSSDFRIGFEYMLVSAFGEVNFAGLSTDFVNGFRYIGQQIAAAFGYYGWDAWSNLWEDFERGWNYTLGKIKSLLQLSSPSGVFKDIAINLVLGLIVGWSSLFGSFLSLIEDGISSILSLFAPILSLFGIDIGGLDAGGLGTAGGGTTGGTTGTQGGSTDGVTNNYFYGTVYIGMDATGALQYDCPSPNPIMTSGSGSLVMNAV
jgi:hypothetical protein